MNWKEFLIRAEKKELIEKKTKNNFLIRLIEKEKPKTILEAGCGQGYYSIKLSLKNYNVTAIDNSKEVIEMCKYNNKILKSKCKFIRKNISEINKYKDLIFNNGVMEHFDKETNIREIKNILNNCKTFIMCVPSYKAELEFGDENLLNYKEWKEIINKANGEIKDFYALGNYKKFLGIYFTIIKLLKLEQATKYINNFIGCDYYFIIKRSGK